MDSGACKGEGQRIENYTEAEAIVETIQRCLEDDAYEDKTMGVIALQGRAQADLIARLLLERLEPRVIEERNLRCGVPATFQGDERDVIFLSLVTAPNIPYRALTREPDKRRFNVALSRPRDQVWLFHSLKQHDLSPDCLRRNTLAFFERTGSFFTKSMGDDRDRLEREIRRRPRRRGEQPDPYGSWFEVDVALELLRRNYRVRPQYPVAGKRIDLVIEGAEARLAVECDGDEWHGPEMYDQDMARQRQLERVGWTFVRIRESAFRADGERALADVINACKELCIRPAGMVADTSQHPEPTESVQADAREAEVLEPREEEDNPDENRCRLGQAERQGQSPETDAAAVKVDDGMNPAGGPFSGYSFDLDFPDPRSAPTARVREAIGHIVQRDAPLTRASIYRLYLEGCRHFQRVGKTVRQAINQALGAMLRAGEILQADELGNGAPEGLVVRGPDDPPVRERPAGRRDLSEIPPSELYVVFDRLQQEGADCDGSSPEEALFRGVLSYYGFTRLTAVRRRHLLAVYRRWRSDSETSDG